MIKSNSIALCHFSLLILYQECINIIECLFRLPHYHRTLWGLTSVHRRNESRFLLRFLLLPVLEVIAAARFMLLREVPETRKVQKE